MSNEQNAQSSFLDTPMDTNSHVASGGVQESGMMSQNEVKTAPQGDTTAPTPKQPEVTPQPQENQAQNQQNQDTQNPEQKSPEEDTQPKMTLTTKMDAGKMKMQAEDPEDAKKQIEEEQEAENFRRLLKEANDASADLESGNRQSRNFEKMPISIPLSNIPELLEYQKREFVVNQANLSEVIADMTSSIQSINNAQSVFTSQFELLTNALKHVTKKSNEKNEDLDRLKSLKKSYQGIGDSTAKPLSMYKDKDDVTLSGSDALMIMTSLTGGMRKLTLWHSGFHITLRSLPLNFLNRFYREINHDDYEFGREFGMFYYLYADLVIAKHVVEHLLPYAICGSSYTHWKDTRKLMSVIAFQDFPVILWALGVMMHPRGANVNFVCAEPGCGYIHSEFVDLSKLRLVNTSMINDDMIRHFKDHDVVTDSMLEEYRKNCKLESTPLTLEYGEDMEKQTWTIYPHQPSISEYVDAGNAYMSALRSQVSITDEDAIQYYTLYNGNKVFKPWINKFTLTVPNPDGGKKSFTVENIPGGENDDAINSILDTFQQHAPNFPQLMQDYILDTKLVHICFYFPECPKCHKEPSTGYHGYIPYDPLRAFFTLALMKLLQGASTEQKQQ